MPNTATTASSVVPRPLTKRAIAIMIMEANAAKPMPETVELLARACQLTRSTARAYYRGLIADGVAPGKVEEHIRAARGPNRPKLVEEPVAESAPTVQEAPTRAPRTRAENRAKLAQIAANKERRLKRA